MSLRCVAFDNLRCRPNLWTRCRRRASFADRLCPRHRAGLDGAILGLMQWEQRLHGADTANEAQIIIPAETRVCKACGARTKWRIPSQRTRRHLLAKAAAGGKKIAEGANSQEEIRPSGDREKITQGPSLPPAGFDEPQRDRRAAGN